MVETNITKNKNRLKNYDNTVYLNNETEFEIELFNSYQSPVLARIKLNGVNISDYGIVLRPGERFFLDRHIDTNNKFKFSSYSIDSSDDQALKAVRSNGKIEIEFYNEKKHQHSFMDNMMFISDSTDDILCNHINFDSSGTNISGNFNINYTGHETNISSLGNSKLRSKTTETGRVEPSEQKSEQKFQLSELEFESLPFVSHTWQLKPQSHKPVETSEIRNYCPNCGLRIKKTSWKYCPKCGQQI